jgi:transcriptional regulator GlxA family with amidase domain/protocatechuate 3,4-dioxygenase beta subunit
VSALDRALVRRKEGDMITWRILRPAVAVLALGTSAALADDAPRELRPLRVGIVVHEGVELLDFAGPTEVFDSAGSSFRIGGQPGFEVVTVAPSPGSILAHGNVTVEPRFTIASCPPIDVLVIPGGATQVLERDDAFVSWVAETSKHATAVLSVCTGAFVLAKAGLLDGGEATTHHSAIAGLRKQAAKTRVVADRRVVDNGKIVTAAGVAAGIDGAFHVVAKLCGRKCAESVAAYMEYRWEPDPALAASYSDWSPLLDAHGRKLQELASARERGDEAAVVEVARRMIAENANDGVAWYELGYALHLQGKIDEAIPAHERAAALPERRSTALYNLACAWALEGEREKSLDALGRAVDAGWNRRATTEADADFASVRGDARFAALLERMGAATPGAPNWASDRLSHGREALAAGRIDEALRLLVDAAGGFPDADDRVRREIQTALARRKGEATETTREARRILEKHPFAGAIALAPPGEPGTPLVVAGVVRDESGRPIAGATLHVFHADATGAYTAMKAMDEPNARLQGWVTTDASGRYELRTVRPGGYAEPRPDVSADAGDERWIPQHVHVEVGAPGRETRRLQMVFDDDPRMTAHWRAWARDGGHPVVTLALDDSGVLRGTCDVTLR